MRELKCHSVIHCGFKKLRKKKTKQNTRVASPPNGTKRQHIPAAVARLCSLALALSFSLSLHRRHYPSLVSDTHLAVALIIVFEGTIITGEVVPERLFETSRQCGLTKTNSPLTLGSAQLCLPLRESRRERRLRAGRRTFSAARLPLWLHLKRGRDAL